MSWFLLACQFIAKHWRACAALAFACAVGAALLYARHHWIQEGRDEYRGKLEQCQAINANLNAAAEAQNAENAKRLAQATQEQQKAVKAEAMANKAAERLVQQVESVNQIMAQGYKDPACRQLMEQKTCVALR